MNKPVAIDLPTAIEHIRAAKRIVLTTHARADGDAMGCVGAMQRVLRQAGKTATGYLHEAVPERYTFLAEQEKLATWDAKDAATVVNDADLLLVLDTCSTMQLDKMADTIRAARCRKLAIDHHITRDDIVDEVFADESAGACAQIIASLCDQAGWKIDETSAALLYTGLATDTGWFRFSNANAAAYATAARLITAGAQPNVLYERLFLNEIIPRARLIGAIMSGFDLLADERLAVMRLSREMLARCGATQQMTEDLINEPQRLGSVVACVLLVEPSDDGPIRVSFRSKREIDVAKIAAQFGGGGHARAAGAKIAGTLSDVEKRVTQAMVGAMNSDR